MNGLMLAKKILRLAYYQSTMETNYCQHAKKCHTCQSYANIIKAPTSELHNLTTPWPFSMWGIDVVGPMPQKAANGHLYIIVAIDYFTKSVKAISLVAVTMKSTTRFIWRDIIYRYGVPIKIITNNATNFVGKILNYFVKSSKSTTITRLHTSHR